MRLVSLSFVALALVACSGGSSSPPSGSSDPSTDPSTNPPDSTDPPSSSKPPSTDPPQTKPPEDPGPTMPSAPAVDVTIGGKAVTVKDVNVSPTTEQYSKSSFSYYTVKATIDASTPIVTGQDGDATIELRVGKTETGASACKEERGPQEGYVEPTTALREVQVHYKRWTGSSTVIAAPTTKSSGACSMTIHGDASKGNAWGEASGSVQSGKDEPSIAFSVKWFEPVKW